MNLSLEQRNALILQYMPLASQIAEKKKKHLYSVDIEELRSAAYMGLVQAIDRYDPAQEGYIARIVLRISGEIKDYLRNLGFGSKGSVSRGCRKFDSIDASAGEGSVALSASLEAKNCDDVVVVFNEITERLSSQGQKLFWHYFVEGRKLKEIGVIMDMTESRISQLIASYRKQIEFA